MTNVLFHQLSGLVAERLVGCGFHPRPCLTKDCKSGTRCLPAERSVFRVGIGGLGQAMTGGVNDGSNAEDNCHILWNVTIAVTLTLTKMLFLSRGHHLKWVVLNYFVPFLSFFFFSATTRKVYEKKLQKLLDQPAAEPETPVDITILPKADSNQNGNTNSDQYSDKEDGELRRHINRHPLFFLLLLLIML